MDDMTIPIFMGLIAFVVMSLLMTVTGDSEEEDAQEDTSVSEEAPQTTSSSIDGDTAEDTEDSDASDEDDEDSEDGAED